MKDSQRMNSVEPQAATGRTKELLDTVQQAFGAVPNAAKVMANSPAVLDSFLAFSVAMNRAEIGDKLHTQVKLTASELNTCDYCTALLSAVGSSAGLTAADILSGRAAAAPDARTAAALRFAKAVMQTHGKVTDEDVRAVRLAGFGDGEVAEIVASVVLGCFTNFLNNVARTDLDFPSAGPVAGPASED